MTKAINTKITFSAPLEFKENLKTLKEEYNLKSISALLQEALKTYAKQKEIEKWEKAAQIMAEEYETNKELKEWSEFTENVYEY